MKSFPPQITNSLQVAARPLMARTTLVRTPKLADCGKKLRTGQLQSGNKAAFSTQTSSGYPSLGSTDRSASSNRALACKQPPLYHQPTKNPQNALGNRISYSTKSSVHGESTIHDVFEEQTGTWQYVIADPSTLMAVIIDPVLDYDRAIQTITTQAADGLLSIVKENGYKVTMILETHAHADHLTAASYLQHRLSQDQGYKPAIGIGKRIKGVQKLFGERYGIPAEEYEGVFDKLFDDDETFNIGNITATVVHLPGHTPDHLGYKIGDNVFCGDSLFHVDIGSARCDFPGGSAKDLFASGRKLLSLSDEVKIWPGHDYPPEGRDAPQPWMTVQQHKEWNLHLKDGMTEKDFIALREKRDTSLAAPKLLHQSLQMNIRAGRLPRATEAGSRMLHLPLKLTCKEW